MEKLREIQSATNKPPCPLPLDSPIFVQVYTWRRRRRVDKEEVKVSRMFASRKSLEWKG
ncbi:hypothetical protein QJS04_geneDACA021172 [Acorus gramineus]|uniref:Uncharacterized protein n=1 Tax=Acorus gramineus TaxID=55184 RepID=A0AAV9ABJ4_ACOGR|nr:hypothetical protein QJS04_geneDACA021172 [Acorus gramineus]